jgi:hypothetical protein
MRILKNNRKTTFVMTEGGSNCPRMTIAASSVRLRDDYKGSMKTHSRLIRKILSVD